MTNQIEELRQKLAGMQARFETLGAAGVAFDMDFALKTEVGGIRSESKRTKRLRREGWDNDAKEMVALRQQIETTQARLRGLEGQATRETAIREHAERMKRTLKPGDMIQTGIYRDPAQVIRLNAKTVTFRLPSGFTDRLPYLNVTLARGDETGGDVAVTAGDR